MKTDSARRLIRRVTATVVACAFLLPSLPANAADESAQSSTQTAQPAQTSQSSRSTTTLEQSNGVGELNAPSKVTSADIARQQAERDGGNGATESTPTQAKEMRNESNNGWPLVTNSLTSVAAKSTIKALADEADNQETSSADGTSIESLSVNWTATTDSTYTRTVTANTPLDFVARVNFSLSGQNAYNAGTIQFTLPLNIFKDRTGADEGALVMSVPEDPTQSAVFNYKRLDNSVVVTNVQKLPAAYQGFFDLKFSQVVPSEVVSGQASEPLSVRMTVATDSGATLNKTSNSIDAVINTQEQITSATKTGSISEIMPTSWKNTSLPSGFDSSQYYYVDWYSYARVNGNQYFTLDITDTPTLSDPYANGIIIGSTIPNAQISSDRKTLTANNAFTGYVDSTSTNFYYHVYMAYPRSEFIVPSGASSSGGQIDVKSMKNDVTYTLTSTDTKQTSAQTATSTVTYRQYLFTVPHGQYFLYKWGVGPNGEGRTLNPDAWISDGDASTAAQKYIGRYTSALNNLANGTSADLAYNVMATNYTYARTYDGTGSVKDPSSYGKRAVDVEIQDTAVTMPDLDSAALTSDDYTIKSLNILDPAMYDYTGSNSQQWSFTHSSTTARPNITLYGKSGSGDWVEYGVASWGNDGTGTISIAAENGASAAGSTLTLPDGVTQWKMKYSTKAAAIFTGVIPTITLKSNDRTKAFAQKLMAETQTPQTDVTNDASMVVSQTVDGTADTLVSQDASGADRLGAASQSVWLEKTAQQTGSDPTKQQVSVHYNATVYEASNQTSEANYNAMIESGALPNDPGGAYYDLLPRNMHVDTSTVKADGLTSVRTVDNWRGTGRTMLIVTVTHTHNAQQYGVNGTRVWGEKLNLEFDATYSWMDMADGAVDASGDTQTMLTNNIAYASNADYLGTVAGRKGEPDDPTAGNNTDSVPATEGVTDAFKDLNSANNNASVVYAKNETAVSAVVYSYSGLFKEVANESDGNWSSVASTGSDTSSTSSVSVPEGGVYRYRLSYRADAGVSVSGIVFYDDLEAYKPDSGSDASASSWQGTFLGVDVADLESDGIAPVIYYATQSPQLQGSTTKPDLTSSIWTTTAPADLSTVKAIAVDCSKKTDGSAYRLPQQKSIQLQLRMRAPTGEAATTAINNNASAFNNVYMSASRNSTSTVFIHHEYTKIGLKPYTVNVLKQWNDDDDRDGLRSQSVTVQLTRNGEAYGEPVTLDSSSEWKHTFENLAQTDESGNAYEWGAIETDTPNGYTLSTSTTPESSSATVTMTNTHNIDTVNASGTKTWSDEQNTSTRPQSITVTLYRDGTAFKTVTVTPDANGTWAYNFGTLPKNHKDSSGKSVAYAYTVKEGYVEGYVPQYTGNGGSGYGNSVAGSNLNDGLNITNTYFPYGDISLTKSTADTTDASADSTFTFKLTLTKASGEPDSQTYNWTRVNADGSPAVLDGASEGTIGTGSTVTVKSGQTVIVHNVPSTDRYTWEEQSLNGFTIGGNTNLSGTVTSGSTAASNVTNVYRTTGGVQLKAKKTLSGRTLRTMQFTFKVQQLDDSGNPVTDANGNAATLRTAYNDANGDVDFSRISYSNADVGKTYTYRISEVNSGRAGYTYDANTYTVKVAVKDNADGTITATPTYYDANGNALGGDGSTVPTFANAYHASGEVNLSVNKVFVGGDLSTRKFTFNITNADGKQVATATTDNDGVATFPALTYTQDDAGKTYEYTVSEVKDGDDAAKIIWDTHTEKVTVHIEDNGDGTLQIHQTFSGQTGTTPLVWTNSAEKGNLKLIKHLYNDTNTKAKRDTQFPMEVTLAVPAGAASFDGTHEVTVGTPTFDSSGSVTSTTESKTTITVKNGKFRVAVPAEGYVQIDGIPGGTSYLVTEVDSVTMPSTSSSGTTTEQ